MLVKGLFLFSSIFENKKRHKKIESTRWIGKYKRNVPKQRASVAEKKQETNFGKWPRSDSSRAMMQGDDGCDRYLARVWSYLKRSCVWTQLEHEVVTRKKAASSKPVVACLRTPFCCESLRLVKDPSRWWTVLGDRRERSNLTPNHCDWSKTMQVLLSVSLEATVGEA